MGPFQVPFAYFLLLLPIQGEFRTSLVQKIVQQTGKIDAAFIHNRFTAPGKEPYSEVLRKTIRDKYSECPVIGYGKKKKAGIEGKDYKLFMVS